MATALPPHPPPPTLPTLQSALLHSILSTHASKLRLDGAASILTSNTSLAISLAQWLSDEKLDMPHSITAVSSQSTPGDIPPALAKAATISIKESPPDDIFTHAFAHVENGSDRKAVLWALKRSFYGLIPKGIAVVSIVTKSPFDGALRHTEDGDGGEELIEQELMTLAERALFEIGKVRLFKREVRIETKDVGKLKAEMEAQAGGSGATVDWEKASSEGVSIEAWFVVAMRWDLLCA